MNSPLILLAVLTVFGSSSYARTISEPDNSIKSDGSNGGSTRIFEARDWVKISQAPPTEITQPLGSTIELECEVTGQPPPSIQWVRGNGPLNNVEDIVENNLITESTPNSLARVRSRLIIDHVISNERSYTCVGRSGSKIAYTTTTVIGEPNIKLHNITELLTMSTNLMNGGKKARIVHYYSVLLEMMSSNIILPCKAVGRPRPEIFWLDTNDNVISGLDPRFKVLQTGELIISDLRWSDMGAYSCVARNAIAKDTVTTFIYPILNDD